MKRPDQKQAPKPARKPEHTVAVGGFVQSSPRHIAPTHGASGAVVDLDVSNAVVDDTGALVGVLCVATGEVVAIPHGRLAAEVLGG